MEEKQIDIIIPAFKVHNTLYQTLCSIAQQTYKDKVKVTIVNDCCPEGSYYKIIKKFKKDLDIEEIKMPKNGGPGLARQYGIDNTKCPYIMFVDADDILLGMAAIENLYKGIEEHNVGVLFSNFLENNQNNILIPHNSDIIWVFGKIYKRQFLKDNNIYFENIRGNEDALFNKKIILSLTYSVPFVDNYFYEWNHNKESSITQINSHQYDFDQGIFTYGKNLFKLIKWGEQQEIEKENLKLEILDYMVYLFFIYNNQLSLKNIFLKQTYELMKEIYYKLWKIYNCDIESESFFNIYKTRFLSFLQREQAGHIILFLENGISFKNLLEDFEKTPYNKQDLLDFYDNILPDEYKKANIECGIVAEDFYKNGGYEED